MLFLSQECESLGPQKASGVVWVMPLAPGQPSFPPGTSPPLIASCLLVYSDLPLSLQPLIQIRGSQPQAQLWLRLCPQFLPLSLSALASCPLSQHIVLGGLQRR